MINRATIRRLSNAPFGYITLEQYNAYNPKSLESKKIVSEIDSIKVTPIACFKYYDNSDLYVPVIDTKSTEYIIELPHVEYTLIESAVSKHLLEQYEYDREITIPDLWQDFDNAMRGRICDIEEILRANL